MGQVGQDGRSEASSVASVWSLPHSFVWRDEDFVHGGFFHSTYVHTYKVTPLAKVTLWPWFLSSQLIHVKVCALELTRECRDAQGREEMCRPGLCPGVRDWRVWDVTGAAWGWCVGCGAESETGWPVPRAVRAKWDSWICSFTYTYYFFLIVKLYMYLVRKVQKNVKEKIGAVEMT